MLENNSSKKGKIAVLPTVIIAALSIGLVASMYLNYVTYKNAQDVKRQTQGEITDLRYQVDKDRIALDGRASPAPSPIASATPVPTATPAAATTLSIPELAVKLMPSAPLADLTYTVIPSQTAGAMVAGLASASFSAKYPGCTSGSVLGQLVRRPSAQTAPASNKYITTIGGYKYYYYNPGNTCATTAPGLADVAAAQAALMNTIFKTLSAQ